MNKIFMICGRSKNRCRNYPVWSTIGRSRPQRQRNLVALASRCYTPHAMPRQRLGQHFLGGIGWRRRILEALPLTPNQTWVEIGPGHGAMTQLLTGDGRRVIAIETDTTLADGLRALVDTEPSRWPAVEIVGGDVLTVNIGDLAWGQFHVYGNLPYYITSPILHHLFGWADRTASIHIVIQLEVAQRITARPGVRDYGYLSTLCQF
ncbi:MAG: rRNA adenine dimethyltransferase family protein, partial [Candidatus Acidiferrales bacterium]